MKNNESPKKKQGTNKSSFIPTFKKYGSILKKRAYLLSTKKTNGLASRGNFDKKLILSLNSSKIPSLNQFKYIGQFLNRQEKKIIRFSSIIIIISLIFLGTRFYFLHIKPAPAFGGSYTENLTGAPQFINPLYSSINTVDSDIVSLVYSGLLKKDLNNQLIPDLAEKFEMNDSETEYTFYLKKEVLWHDDKVLTADDIIFTYQAIVANDYKSPLKVSFEGVIIERIDDYTVKFILQEPYSAFLELLTTGILPAHIWQQIPANAVHLADLNLKPIGTGPYKFKSLTKDKNGVIHGYILEINKKYHNQKPHIKEIAFKFSPNFIEGINALNEGRVEGVDYIPKEYQDKIIAPNGYNQYYLEQPQLTALFFNQTQLGALGDLHVRQALAYALNKEQIISDDDKNFMDVIDGPMLPIFNDYQNNEIETYQHDLAKAKQLLDNAGWLITEVQESSNQEGDENSEETSEPVIEPGIWRKKENNFLRVTITTVDQEDNTAIAKRIKSFWEELNVHVTIETISADLIQNEIIKPRNYQILLFGIILGADPDQYAFWHSSQIGSNGLNLANYNNKQVDELLEDGRITGDKEVRQEKYKKFQKLITKDIPAIFLFSQKYPYLQTNRVKGFDMTSIVVPSDRFNNVTNWYIKTRRKITW